MPRLPRRPAWNSPSSRPGLPANAVLLGLSILVAAATVALVLPTANAIYCERLSPLAVLAALAATLIALCFRALAQRRQSRPGTVMLAALLFAALSLFLAAGFLKKYYPACHQLEQELEQRRHSH